MLHGLCSLSRTGFTPVHAISSYSGVGDEFLGSKLKWLMRNRVPAMGIPWKKKNLLIEIVQKIDEQES